MRFSALVICMLATISYVAAANAQSCSSESVADWQQEQKDKIDDLNQQIAQHEQQAQQDDADADDAQAQVSQNESASYGGAGAGFLALGNFVQGSVNAGLAVHDRQQAQDERRQAQEEQQQIAQLASEQPPQQCSSH